MFPMMNKSLFRLSFRCSIIYDGPEAVLFVTDPCLVKQITVADFDHFVDNGVLSDAVTSSPANDFGLITAKGEHWRRLKASMSPAFTLSNIKTMAKSIDEVREQN